MKTIGNAPNISAYAGSVNQLRTGSISEDRYIRGKAFSFEDYFIFASGEVKLFVFDPALYLGPLLDFNPIILASTSGPVLLDFYYNFLGAADGTLLMASNRRAGFAGPLGTFRLNPTPTVEGEFGTRFAGDLVPATGLNPNKSAGSANEKSLRFEPSRTLKTAFTLTNLDGANNYLQMKLTWFET